MSFYDTNFPDDISYGSKGGPEFNTTVITLRSGNEQRNVNWQYPLHRYNVSYGIRTEAQMAAVHTFFMSMLGKAHTFRYKDWHDYASGSDGKTRAATDQTVSILVSTTASSVARYQLRKLYTQSSATLERTITKVVSGTVSVAVNGWGYRTSNVSVNNTTGIMELSGSTFNILAISKSTQAQLLLNTSPSTAYASGMRSVYIKDVTGMTEINDARYQIASVTGVVMTLDVNSTGFTTYIAGGVAREHLFSAEVSGATASVTAGFEFDVPCRFDSDVFDPVHTAYNQTDLQIDVVEVRE
jgi:uncharacterized protein (TIGR02217 family)